MISLLVHPLSAVMFLAMKHSSHGSSPKASLGSVDDPMDILHQLIGVHPDHTINSFSMETTQFGTTATVEILLSPESLAKMYEELD